MSHANTEIEVKLRFESAAAAREALEKLGASLVEPRVFEDNVLYDRAHAPLRDAGKLLRLRRVGERVVLTYKAPVAGEHRHKVREEHETRVGEFEAAVRILDGLGFFPSYRYQKYRTLYAIGGVHACVDETPIGCFVELEGEPEAIDRVAERLGFAQDRYIRGTYRDLHEEAAGTSGPELGDLVF